MILSKYDRVRNFEQFRKIEKLEHWYIMLEHEYNLNKEGISIFASYRIVIASHTGEELKQRCYLEIVVRFNRDIPTLVTSSRVPEVQTQLDTYQLVSTHESLDSCRSVTLAERIRFEELLSKSLSLQDPGSLKISQKTFFGCNANSSGHHLQGEFLRLFV